MKKIEDSPLKTQADGQPTFMLPSNYLRNYVGDDVDLRISIKQLLLISECKELFVLF